MSSGFSSEIQRETPKFDSRAFDFTKTRDDVLSIRDSGLSGISDDEVYEKACKGNMVIITIDKDFTRIFRFPPEKCSGIVVAKIYKRTLDETLAIFKKYYPSIKEEDIKENLVIITPEGVRIKRSTK